MRIRTGIALAASVALATAANAHATTFTVTRTDDPAPDVCDSNCSLREAVLAANAGAAGDTIQLPAGLFRLTRAGAGENAAATGDLDLAKNVTITGAGARSTVIDATGSDRVFEVQAGVFAQIAGATITGGLVDGDGGGIANQGSLTLLRDTITGNEAALASNRAGGGIESSGSLTVVDTTVGRNRAYNGGGIDATALTLTNSTVSGNVAGGPGSNGDGGGIEGLSMTAVTSTIAHNVSFNGVGSGGGLHVGSASLRNTIVAANLSHQPDQSTATVDNCSVATLTSQGHNLSDGGNCAFIAAGDLQNADARLSGLGDHGGPTDTEALFQGSAAIDTGGACSATLDQRGTTRPRGTACDIGSYELAPPLVATTAAVNVVLTSASLRGTLGPSSQVTSFHFEYGTTTAYGSTSQTLSLPPGGAPVVVSTFVGGLKQGTTYHFRLVASNGDGTVLGADQAFTTNDRVKPMLTLLKVAPGIFRAAKGTKISFTLSEPATVTFKVDRVLPGVRRGRRCVAKRRRIRGRACTRYLRVKGTLVQAGTAGANKIDFDATLNGRLLAPAAYRLSASPRDQGLNLGKTVVTAFRIRR